MQQNWDLTAALKDVNGFQSGGIGKIALHAGAGCISSVAGGGDCKSGAMSGAVGQLGLHLPDGSKEFNTIKAAMLGGIGSKLAGGKFEDGAVTGAFGYLFNDFNHPDPVEDIKKAGEKVMKNAVDGAQKIAEFGADAIAACGVLIGACRGADLALSGLKAGADWLQGNTTTAKGVLAGTVAEKGTTTVLNVVNSKILKGAFPSIFTNGYGYVVGKGAEHTYIHNSQQATKP